VRRIRVELATVVEEPMGTGLSRSVFGKRIVLEVPVEDCAIESDAHEKVRAALQKLVDEA